MAIIISILKWLLIILLVLVILVLLLTACLLFVPVRYYVYGQQDGSWSMRGNAGWLFHILHFSFEVRKEEMKKSLRIFGIPISLDGKKTKKKSSRKPKKKTDSHTSKEPGAQDLPKKETKSSQPPATKVSTQKGSGKKNRNKKNSLSIKEVLAKIKKGIAMICRVLTEGPRAFVEGTKAEKFIDILCDSNTLELWRLILANLGRLWRHSKPKRIKGRIHFGTSDPCTTGQLLGVIGTGFGVIGSGVTIEPDFEEAVLEGYLKMRGRVQVYLLLLVLKDVFWSKEWKYFKEQSDK